MKQLVIPVLTALALMTVQPLKAASASPECEMRSTWIATVYSLDWPGSKISQTGNEKEINSQKSSLVRMLDSLAVNNFNAAKLQVRSRCDAFYKSSYEPWSGDLVSQRGMDPGYDPLEFFVEECHARGMEAHAWVNPYRYETSVGAFTGTPRAYRDEHPDWLLDVGSASILNPALPEVRQRICDVVAEIVGNYDIDGLLFDDYFYLQGIKDQDAEQYQAYTKAGGKLGLNDWRRENINAMVRDVYATIKRIKPWVRFGIGPAGITCSSVEQADKHHVPVCTSGSDYQYNGIFSDPLAWLEDKAVDYISPQIYWAIGYPDADFDIISKWWSDRMPRYNRHLFISKDISALNSQSKTPGIMRASGEGVNTFDQYRRQIEMTREYSTDGEPGSVFYRAAFLYSSAPLFAHFLHTNVYGRKALLPSMHWLAAKPCGLVTDLKFSGQKLSWTAVPDVRYAVFGHDGPDREVLGFTYTNEFDVPAGYAATGKVSVAVYDRYGNVYSLRTLGEDIRTLGAPAMTAPGAGQVIEAPFDFGWTEVAGAESYILEIGTDASVETPLATRRVWGATLLSSNDIDNLPTGQRLYARVRALADNATGSPSASIPFETFRMTMTSPCEGDTVATLMPTVSWNCNDRDVTVEIASDVNFKTIVHSNTVHADSYTLPRYTLESNKRYYARLRFERSGEDCQTDIVGFITPGVDESVPTVSHPVAGGVLHADGRIAVHPLEGIHQIRVEVAASSSFPSRSLYVTSAFATPGFADAKTGSEIKIGGKGLVDGQTYYIRARGTYNAADGGTSTTEYGPVTTFTYSATDGVDDVKADGEGVITVSVDGLTVAVGGLLAGPVTLCDASGRVIAASNATAATMTIPAPAPGLYILTNAGRTVKLNVR